jgi:hypothetical protein
VLGPRHASIDWWASPSRDLADQVARDRNVTLVSHYMPAMGILRFNPLYARFAIQVVERPESSRIGCSAIRRSAICSKAPFKILYFRSLIHNRTSFLDVSPTCLSRRRDTALTLTLRFRRMMRVNLRSDCVKGKP